jgi:hypothetical protein
MSKQLYIFLTFSIALLFPLKMYSFSVSQSAGWCFCCCPPMTSTTTSCSQLDQHGRLPWAQLLLLGLHGYLDQLHLGGPHDLNPPVHGELVGYFLPPALLWLLQEHHVLNSTRVILLIPATASRPWTTSPCPCDLSPPQQLYTSCPQVSGWSSSWTSWCLHPCSWC